MIVRRRGIADYAMLALLVALGIAFAALAVWQVERRAWKHALIARVDARVHATPVDAPGPSQWPRVDRDTDEYRHVVVRGTWLEGHDTFVRAVTALGGGFWLLTPLRRPDGSVVLVDRGFVAAADRARMAAVPPANGPVAVTGLLRMPEPGGGFLQDNDAAADRWFSRDVAAIAARRGLADVAPYFVDADADADANPDNPEAAVARGGPVGGLTVVAFTDNHLLYAAIWTVLATMCAGAVVFVVRRPRGAG